uniref:Uncharacterized protein n=1 Tax=Anguilla anguilla TaxID=7936 RepID=A0A0E9UR86_ANGAN
MWSCFLHSQAPQYKNVLLIIKLMMQVKVTSCEIFLFPFRNFQPIFQISTTT